MPTEAHDNMLNRRCLFCKGQMWVRPSQARKGGGLYCSNECRHKHRNAEFAERASAEASCVCATCGNNFYRPPSRRGGRAKSGLVFCSTECKCRAQRIGGIKGIQPAHYGESAQYRVLAERLYEKKCRLCGYDRCESALHVHHIDCNHTNDDPSNLVWLCCRCHVEVHCGLIVVGGAGVEPATSDL